MSFIDATNVQNTRIHDQEDGITRSKSGKSQIYCAGCAFKRQHIDMSYSASISVAQNILEK
jgi:hypothetical protein